MFTFDSEKQKKCRNSSFQRKKSQVENFLPKIDSTSLSAEIKSALYLPPFESVDPLILCNRLFTENFLPSDESVEKYIMTSSMNKPNKKNFFKSFSYICFERGHLASAILKEEGKVLLLAAIEKAIAPIKLQETKQFELSPDIADIGGKSVALYDDCKGSAYSLALDASKSASKALETIKTAIDKDNPTGHNEMKTMEYILPFVSLNREKLLIEEYQKEL